MGFNMEHFLAKQVQENIEDEPHNIYRFFVGLAIRMKNVWSELVDSDYRPQ